MLSYEQMSPEELWDALATALGWGTIPGHAGVAEDDTGTPVSLPDWTLNINDAVAVARVAFPDAVFVLSFAPTGITARVEGFEMYGFHETSGAMAVCIALLHALDERKEGKA